MTTNGISVGDWTYDYSYQDDEDIYHYKKRKVIEITEKQKGIVLAHFDIKSQEAANVKSLIKWTPMPNEWMWFKDNNSMEYKLKRFKQMCPIIPTNYISVEGMISGTVEPYVGRLPNWCKYIDAKEKY